jgi:hypothetical protein
MTAIDNVILYLYGTKHLGLRFTSSHDFFLFGTVDASYACHLDLKSHTGCTLHMTPNSASFLSLSKKQTILADSSTVAEYIGAHLAAKQILWARNILYEMNLSQIKPTTLYEDNKSTITLLNNPGNGNRTKHIALRYNFLRDEIKKGVISMFRANLSIRVYVKACHVYCC